jgi:hypothetical protein
MNFRDAACNHLANYKVDQLGVKENGEFHYRGEILEKAHILPRKHLKLNIIEEYRDRFFDSEYAQINDKERGRESFLDRPATLSVEIPPCHAAHALLLETSPIMS